MKIKNRQIQIQRVVANGVTVTIDIPVEGMLWYIMYISQGAVASFTVAMQYSLDGGATWFNIGNSVNNTTTQKTHMTNLIPAKLLRLSITNGSGAQRTYVADINLLGYSSLSASAGAAV